MVLLIIGIAGCVGGAVAARRYAHKLDEAEARASHSAARKAIKDGRKALLIGHTIVRAQLSRAFLATARCAHSNFDMTQQKRHVFEATGQLTLHCHLVSLCCNMILRLAFLRRETAPQPHNKLAC